MAEAKKIDAKDTELLDKDGKVIPRGMTTEAAIGAWNPAVDAVTTNVASSAFSALTGLANGLSLGNPTRKAVTKEVSTYTGAALDNAWKAGWIKQQGFNPLRIINGFKKAAMGIVVPAAVVMDAWHEIGAILGPHSSPKKLREATTFEDYEEKAINNSALYSTVA